MKTNELVCIVCPIGCRLTVETGEDGKLIFSGNNCKRGEEYALRETTNPTRTLPTTVKITGGILTRLPVRTAQAIPKKLIFECMKELRKIEVQAPIKMGDIIIKNILKTGVDVIASRSMEKSKRALN